MSSNAAVVLDRPTPSYDFNSMLRKTQHYPLTRAPLSELQINLGRLCNQACEHCHVDAGPKRTEIMTWETMEKIIDWARKHNIKAADLTGGAPELNPHFRPFVDTLLDLDISIKSRCNLTVMFEPNQEDLADWYAKRKTNVICSLPCYTSNNVDSQRGRGVFDKSIRALQLLNKAGYGVDKDLRLDLVYNPGGPFLPPPQEKLRSDYRQKLFDDFGIVFTELFTLTNLPINRFQHFLKRTGQADDYQMLLEQNFNNATVPGLMCRHLLSVDWLGQVYDCDFNQMLDLPAGGKSSYLWELDGEDLTGADIAIGPHCFGCTAGAGSSCGGALT